MVNEDQFLAFVSEYVAEHPSVGAHVAAYAQAGLQQALARAYDRAADMEVALVCALAPRMKNSREVIKDKLAKWDGKTSCRWDWFIKPSDQATGSKS